MLCNRAVTAIVLSASLLAATNAGAQTLLDPYPKADPPAAPNKPHPGSTRNRACSSYGPGFAQLPGTDTCVKIGGFVRFEAAGGR